MRLLERLGLRCQAIAQPQDKITLTHKMECGLDASIELELEPNQEPIKPKHRSLEGVQMVLAGDSKEEIAEVMTDAIANMIKLQLLKLNVIHKKDKQVK